MIDRPDKNTPKFPWFVTVSTHEPDAFLEEDETARRKPGLGNRVAVSLSGRGSGITED
ncbi:hypothetical protein HW008_002806 [Salmonella enterica]|nr:hypothetical protein [Salmonella enterica]